VETVLAILFLIPKTPKLGAACIAVYMIGPILSHVFVLGYGTFFLNTLATFILPCIYLYLRVCRPLLQRRRGLGKLCLKFIQGLKPKSRLGIYAAEAAAS
jgi:hypothetical protein